MHDRTFGHLRPQWQGKTFTLGNFLHLMEKLSILDWLFEVNGTLVGTDGHYEQDDNLSSNEVCWKRGFKKPRYIYSYFLTWTSSNTARTATGSTADMREAKTRDCSTDISTPHTPHTLYIDAPTAKALKTVPSIQQYSLRTLDPPRMYVLWLICNFCWNDCSSNQSYSKSVHPTDRNTFILENSQIMWKHPMGFTYDGV